MSNLARIRSLGPGRLEGWRSGVSLAATRALHDGLAAIYQGLAPLVRAAAPAIHRAVDAALVDSGARLAALGQPLERAVEGRPEEYRRARAAAHTLEIALRTGLVQALGITLTFRSVDGD